MDKNAEREIEKVYNKNMDAVLEELDKNGIFYEDQFDKIGSMFHKKYASKIAEYFSKRTKWNINIAHNQCYFAYFDRERYTYDEATKLIAKFYKF